MLHQQWMILMSSVFEGSLKLFKTLILLIKFFFSEPISMTQRIACLSQYVCFVILSINFSYLSILSDYQLYLYFHQPIGIYCNQCDQIFCRGQNHSQLCLLKCNAAISRICIQFLLFGDGIHVSSNYSSILLKNKKLQSYFCNIMMIEILLCTHFSISG